MSGQYRYDWKTPTDYGLVIHDKEYCDRMFTSDNTHYFRGANYAKNKFKKSWAGKIVFLSHYGQQQSLGIPDFAVEFKIYRNENPEYFI